MSCFAAKYLNFILIFIGVILRLKHYFDNRSFWSDEAAMAIYLNTRSLHDIISRQHILPSLPNDPIGFSIVEKIIVGLLGNNEYAFRLFPLICGIASLFLFYSFLKRHIDPKVIPVLLGIFSLSEAHIYYSSEFRRYTCGIVIALLLYRLMSNIDSKPMTLKRFILYALVGSISIAFSYSSVFILTGIGLTQILRVFRKKDWMRLKYLIFSYSFWLCSFICIYYLYCKYMFTGTNPIVLRCKSYFIPDPIWSLNAVKWAGQLIVGFVGVSMGLVPSWVGIYFLVLGTLFLWRKNKENLSVLMLPVLLAFLASAFHKYLLADRYLLIFVPGLLIVFGYGVARTMRSNNKFYLVLHVFFVALLFIHPVKMASYNITHHYVKQEIRPLMRYLKEHQQKDDVLYMNNSAQFAYSYYFKHFNFHNQFRQVFKTFDVFKEDSEGKYIMKAPITFVERGNRDILPFFNPRKAVTINANTQNPFGNNKRTWILFSHYNEETKMFVLGLLNRRGRELKELKNVGSELYLYELGQ